MLNISRGRSSSVPQNRFLRRLILHFDLLQDETATMNQATTILFLLVNLYIQIVPTNNTVDSSLNMLLGSAKMVPTIFSAGLFVSIILLLILLVSLIFENKYLDRNCTLDPPKHLKSVWYKFYKHLFRFHFLLLEPILSGYTLSLILPKSAFDVYPLRFQVFAIVGGTLGLLLSIPYFCLVESILPSSSWTSATNKYNIALTTIGLRLCIFLDYVYTSATDMALIGILMVIRISPSIIATYINLFATHFFNKHARVLFVGYQVSNIIYSIIFFVMGNDSTSLTLIPACFFIALGLRAVYNMDLMSRANLQHLSANKLSDILTLASHITDSQKENVVSASTEALRFQAVMAHLTSGRKELYEEYCETFASTDEKAHDNERNTSLFMVYLFERCWQSSGQKDFRTLVYETLFALTMRLNLFHISTMLARLHSLDLNVVEQSTLRALIRRIELSAKEIYLDKLSLIPVREQFYAPKSVAETNEAIANKLKLNNIEDDSRDYGDQAKTHVTAKVIRSSDLLHFDIYSSMQTIEQYEKLVNRMQDVIFTILKFYDKLKNRVVDVANAHETMKRIKILKEKVNKAFRTLDKSSGDQNIFHLLPYALFLETINNDRQASQKVLKAYEHRSQLLERSMNMSRGRTSSSKFSLDQMLCISVDCTRNSLGRMNYISSNSEEVFGLHPKHFEGRNIHTLMSDDFQTIHDEFLDKFVKDQDKPYLGVSRERHVRVHDNVYTKCDVLVKLSPVLNPTSLSFMCLLKKRVNDEEFIVINHQGVIIGRSQALDWADQLWKQDFSTLGPTIPHAISINIKKFLLKNKGVLSKVGTIAELPSPSNKLGMVSKADANTVYGISANASYMHIDTFSKDLAQERQNMAGVMDTAQARPVEFMYHRKQMFVDLLIKFKLEKLVLNHTVSKDDHLASSSKSTQSLIAPQDEEIPVENRPQESPMNGSHPSRLDVESYNADRPTSPSHFEDTRQDLKAGILPSRNKKKSKQSDSPINVRFKKILHGSTFARTSTKRGVTGALAAVFQRKKHHLAKLESDQLATKNASGIEEDPIIFDDGQSSVKSALATGNVYSGKVKAKVLATIKYHKKRLGWKEILGIVLLQVLTWSTCLVLIFQLNNSFNIELKELIALRTAFGKNFMMSQMAFQAGIVIMERMLVYQGKISSNKYQPILPSIDRKLDGAVARVIVNIQGWYQKLVAHIYSFEYKYSQRYLSEVYNYSYHYNGQDTMNNQTMTKQLNLLEQGRESIYLVSRWNTLLEATKVNFSHNNMLVIDYYELMTKAWKSVNYNTIARILDSDTQNYQALVKQVTTWALIGIPICIALAATSVFLFSLLRKKTAELYSILESLLPFEISLVHDRLVTIHRHLTLHAKSAARMKPIVTRLIRSHDSSYQQLWQRNKSSRVFIKKHLGSISWFGTGWFTILAFLLTVTYQIVNYFSVTNFGSKLDRLLLLQRQQRAMMEAANMMSMVNLYAYFVTVKVTSSFNTSTWPTFEVIMDNIDAYSKDLDNLMTQTDIFVSQVPSDREETLNFGDLLVGKPCDYLDYKFHKLPRSECEMLADRTYNQTIIEAFRWLRQAMPGMLRQMRAMKYSRNQINFLVSKDFLTFEFGKRFLYVEYVYQFTTEFFNRLETYHKEKFIKPLNTNLVEALVLCLIASLLVVGYAASVALKNISDGLQVFLLVPPESYYHNPHIAAKLLTITR